MSINKSEFVSKIADDTGLSKADAGRAYDSFISILKDSIVGGDEVRLPGIGTFKSVPRAARTGFNPATGDKIDIPAKTALKFKQSTALAL